MKSAQRVFVFLLAAVFVATSLDFASASSKQTQWKAKFRNQQKIERSLASVENSLQALERFQRDALPNVSLGGEARSAVPKQLKFVRVHLRNLKSEKLPEEGQAKVEDLNSRYQAVKVFFAAKEQEVVSPAQQFVRLLHEKLEDLEAGAERGVASQKELDARLLAIWDTARTVTRIQEHDASYPLDEVLERFEPHAEEYVVAKQELLEIQPGAEEQQHAIYYLGLVQTRIESEVPPHDAKLKEFLEKAGELLKASKELAPSYFNPEHMEEKMKEFWDYTVVPEPKSPQPT